MPRKFNVSDFTFYFIKDEEGKYIFKDESGNIFRKLSSDFERMMAMISEKDRAVFQKLDAIANVQSVETKENILVYEIFSDLRNIYDNSRH